MRIAVREAEPSDAASIASLNSFVHDVHVASEPETFRPTDRVEVERFFAAHLADPSQLLLVAETADGPVGYLWANTLQPNNPFKHEKRTLYVHHLAVASAARGHGCGAALLRAAERGAVARGIGTVALDHWSFNTGAARFFSAAGYVPYNVRLRKEL